MPPEDNFSDVAFDAPSENRMGASIDDLAHAGQDKPQDLKDKEETRQELRRLGKTPSSKDLPRVDWYSTDAGTLIIQFANKLVTKQLAPNDPIDLTGSVTSDQPAVKADSKNATPGLDSSAFANITVVKSPDGSVALGVGDVKINGKTEAEHGADEVYHSLHLWNEPDRLNKALEGKNREQLQAMNKAFEKDHGMSMKEYILKETKEGSPEQEKALELLKPLEQTLEPTGDKFDSPERKHLKELESQLPEKDRAKFEQDMADFEKRAAEAKPPLTQEQVAATYKEMAKLIEAPDNPKLKDSAGHALDHNDRVTIAEQILNHAAHPEMIDQGFHSSCGAAAVEQRVFAVHPEDAAKMIADVATTGEFKNKDNGRVIRPDLDALLHPDAAGQKAYPPVDNERTMASQLFQVTAISSVYASYRQIEPVPGHKPPDTGERITDLDGKMVDGKLPLKDFPGLTTFQEQDIAKHITGKEESGSFIENGAFRPDQKYTNDHTHYVNSEADLKEQLAEMKKNGRLPAVISVYTGNEPYRADSHAGDAGGSGGWHAVTITDYDETTGKVSVANQWGKGARHIQHDGQGGLSVGELYAATNGPRPGESRQQSLMHEIEDLKKQVADERKEGQPNHAVELELLRKQHEAGQISDKDYQAAVQKTMVQAVRDWKKQRESGQNIDLDEFNRITQNEFLHMISELPPKDRDRIFNAVMKETQTPAAPATPKPVKR